MNIDFSNNVNIIKLYNNICTKNYLNARKHLNEIKQLNTYVEEYLSKNNNTDIRNSSLTIYSEKINKIYLDKKESFHIKVLNLLMVIGTFGMVIITFVSILLRNK